MIGTYLRQAGLEAPDQTGRGEQHGGVIKSAMKVVIKEHRVIGKDQMKQVAIIAMEGKSDNITKGGFAPSLLVLGKFPWRPGRLREEDEWGQLGVLAASRTPQPPLANAQHGG